LNSSANNIGDSNEKGKFESDYQKKYEEILDKVDQQEKLLVILWFQDDLIFFWKIE